jgi:hypothetical protein
MKQKNFEVTAKEFIARGLKASAAFNEVVAKSKKVLAKKAKPKYKTAKALKITSLERKYLIETADLLSTMSMKDHREIHGEVFHFDLGEWYDAGDVFADKTEKRDGHNRRSCNSTACVKGWMQQLAIRDKTTSELFGTASNNKFGISRNSKILNALFTPNFDRGAFSYEDVTPKEAARTIKKFLKTGKIQYPKKYEHPANRSFIDDDTHL